MLFKVYKTWDFYDGGASEFIEEKEFSSFEELFEYVEMKEDEWNGIGKVYRGEIHIEII